MPNWCNNVVEISHVSKDMMERVIKTAESGLLQEFVPCPQELLDTVAGSVGAKGSVEQDALELKEELNFKKYGAKNWYDWCVANWGTKWDICEASVEVKDDGFAATLTFETAWSPPIEAYNKLIDLGFEIKAYYYEPGMCFVGMYDNGHDQCAEYGGETSETVREVIGEQLDDMFGISECMAEWEAE